MGGGIARAAVRGAIVLVLAGSFVNFFPRLGWISESNREYSILYLVGSVASVPYLLLRERGRVGYLAASLLVLFSLAYAAQLVPRPVPGPIALTVPFDRNGGAADPSHPFRLLAPGVGSSGAGSPEGGCAHRLPSAETGVVLCSAVPPSRVVTSVGERFPPVLIASFGDAGRESFTFAAFTIPEVDGRGGGFRGRVYLRRVGSLLRDFPGPVVVTARTGLTAFSTFHPIFEQVTGTSNVPGGVFEYLLPGDHLYLFAKGAKVEGF